MMDIIVTLDFYQHRPPRISFLLRVTHTRPTRNVLLIDIFCDKDLLIEEIK